MQDQASVIHERIYIGGGGGGLKLEKILDRTTCSPEFQ